MSTATDTTTQIPWWKEPTKDQWIAWWAAWLAVAVSREIMARVDAEIDKLEQLAATEVTAVNRLALVREVEAASGG